MKEIQTDRRGRESERDDSEKKREREKEEAMEGKRRGWDGIRRY